MLTQTPFDALAAMIAEAQPILSAEARTQAKKVAQKRLARRGPFGPGVYAGLAEEQRLANLRQGHERSREVEVENRPSVIEAEGRRKPVYPCGGFSSRSWVEVRDVQASERPNYSLGFNGQMVVNSSGWDLDRGAGRR